MAHNIDINKFKTPGQLIEFLLEHKGWTKRVLAIILGQDETAISKIVSSKRSVTGEMAVLLEEVFGTDADYFMQLQKSYDLAKARITAQPDPGRNTRAHLFGGLPVAEMIKRGWLVNATDIRNVKSVEESLAKFFGVSSF